MLSLHTVWRGLKYPSLTGRVLNQKLTSHGRTVPYNDAGINVLAEDWDNLIILDACRYDLLKQHFPESSLKGNLSSKVSRGSDTVEFLRGNFRGRRLGDIVYTTANPQLYRNRDHIDAKFHSVVDVWDLEGWDDDIGTVLPSTTSEYGRRAADKHPHKRHIIHYIQPHCPFLTSETNFGKGLLGAKSENPWVAKHKRKVAVSRSELWGYYSETLKAALPHVAKLVGRLHGKTVVTADHGNIVGERSSPIPTRGWGHPGGVYTEELVKVPWLEMPFDSRREIADDGVSEQKTDVDSDVGDRLSALGYA